MPQETDKTKSRVEPGRETAPAKPHRFARSMAQYSSLLVALPASVLGGYWLGSWLDDMWDTKPVFGMSLLLVGAVVGFYQMYRIISKTS